MTIHIAHSVIIFSFFLMISLKLWSYVMSAIMIVLFSYVQSNKTMVHLVMTRDNPSHILSWIANEHPYLAVMSPLWQWTTVMSVCENRTRNSSVQMYPLNVSFLTAIIMMFKMIIVNDGYNFTFNSFSYSLTEFFIAWTESKVLRYYHQYSCIPIWCLLHVTSTYRGTSICMTRIQPFITALKHS